MSTDAKATIGRMIRLLRESEGLSQEKLAARAGLTYQYLSAVENGKENFTVGILESIANALGVEFLSLIERAYTDSSPIPTVKPDCFIPGAALPPELHLSHIESVLNETHKVIRLINTTLKRILASYTL